MTGSDLVKFSQAFADFAKIMSRGTCRILEEGIGGSSLRWGPGGVEEWGSILGIGETAEGVECVKVGRNLKGG